MLIVRTSMLAVCPRFKDSSLSGGGGGDAREVLRGTLSRTEPRE